MKRDSSPPEAIRVSGPNGAPGLVETSNSTRSVPAGPGSASAIAVRKRAESSLSGEKLGGDRGIQPRCRLTTLVSQLPCRFGIGLPRGQEGAVELGEMLAAGLDGRQLVAHLCAERGERVGLDAMLARQSANVEQPSFDLVETRWIEGQRVGGAGNSVLGLASLDQRSVQRGESFSEQRMVGCSAFDPPRRVTQLRDRAFRAAEQLVEPGQGFARLEAGLHSAALFRQALFLAFLWSQALDFRARMLQPFAVALRRRRLGARRARSASIWVTSVQAAATAPVSSLPNASSKAR